MRAQDLFPDGFDGIDVNGTYVRKGSLGSFVYDALALDELDPTSREYAQSETELRELVPVLRATRILEVFALRSDRVAALVREADPSLL